MSRINKICILSGSTCNLNCSFCFLYKNQSYKKFDAVVEQAWTDGSYLNNIIKTLKTMEVHATDIRTIEIWGGEPTLGLHSINDNLINLLQLFPKLNKIFISTNWTNIPISDLISFITIIDQNINKELTFNLQLSIDGPPGDINKYGHPGDWNKYLSNIDLFFSEINQIKLYNIKINLLFHSVVDQEIALKELNTYEKIKDYIIGMSSLIETFYQKCINGSCNINKVIGFPSIAAPHKSSLKQGLELANCVKLFDQVKHELLPELDPFPSYMTLGGYEHFASFDDMSMECGESGYATFTILPDGTIAECSSSYICDFEDYNQELLNSQNKEQYKISQIRKKHYFNPINATDEEIENYKWYVSDGGIRGISAIYRNLNLGLLDELALSKQIPYDFHLNPEKALAHLTNTMVLQYCTRDNTIETHNPSICSPSTFRKYFNGITDLIYTQDQAQIKYNLNYFINDPDLDKKPIERFIQEEEKEIWKNI